MLGKTEVNNYSRVISYDLSLSDSPTTFYDDRMCVYNIPTNGDAPRGNNQVIGLTVNSERVWIGESRSLFGSGLSAISSFLPNSENCGNLVNLEDAVAMASQNLQYGNTNETPEQDACIEQFLLDSAPPNIKLPPILSMILCGLQTPTVAILAI